MIPRRAGPADREGIERLAALSFGAEAGRIYEASIVAACLPRVATLDPRLLDSLPYFVIDGGGAPIAAGGWGPMDGHGWTGAAAQGLSAQVRAVWVHPDRLRQSLGRAVMSALEADAGGRGHHAIGVRASLNAIPFYAALGYRARAVAEVPLGDGLVLPAALMAKPLAAL